jgi:solute carrier family 12 sodium/potassium/chloride transporter 2
MEINKTQKKFGTFAGVFTPDVLTILGVILYLRLGWVVGNTGFLGALFIILMAKTITITTGLSMSSITTNIKIGAGGAYSIISKSLGLEAGGSVGIPFYISQTLSAALYIVGFTEGWLRIFPSHNYYLIAILTWMVVLTISYISANVAIKTQYFIMMIIALSLASFVLGETPETSQLTLVGNLEDVSFWGAFAIFFPAVTGIMAGANLSGELKNPKIAIPRGTMAAIAITLVIYVALAYLFSSRISAEVLRSNQMAMIDYALWAPAVIMGILAATFSSALGSTVGAPRILQALAAFKSVPFHRVFVQKNENGEPANATIFTGVISLIAIILGNLDALATLITMFFLITYGTLNAVVLIQQSMKIISFRPSFRIPRFIPLIGTVSCGAVMFLINPIFGIVAIGVIILIYFILVRKGLDPQWGDIRGGMFLALAEYTSNLAAKFPRHKINWKPDLLLPVESPEEWKGAINFVHSLVAPSGSVFAFSVQKDNIEDRERSIQQLIRPLRKTINANAVIIEEETFIHGAKIVIQTLRGGAFRPNILFLNISQSSDKDGQIKSLVEYTIAKGMGVILLRRHTEKNFGEQKNINIWLRDKSPNWHLAILLALHLQSNWDADIHLLTVTNDASEKERLHRFLSRLSDEARLPSSTEHHVLTGNFESIFAIAPKADLQIFGMTGGFSIDGLRKVAELADSSAIFVNDSGEESAFA